MENLIGQMVHVCVSQSGKTATKLLKVCKVKARSVLFIEVDRENRKNIFRKVNLKDITSQGTIGDSPYIYVKEGVLPDKWESAWDAIGGFSNSVQSYGRFAQAAKPFSNHSKGWAATIKRPMGSSIDALAANPPWKKSTTNSAAGFPMV
jgi:hypothetical protein